MNVISAATIVSDIDGDELTELQVEAFESIESYAEYVRDQIGDAKGRIACRDARIDQLKAQNTADENHAEWCRKRLDEGMRIAGLEKVKTPLVSCFRKKTESVVVECELSELPVWFLRSKTTVEPDKVKLKEALALNSGAVSGVRLETKETLVVK